MSEQNSSSQGCRQPRVSALLGADCEALPPVLDPCCGSRMFWFDREDDRAVFGDIRQAEYSLTDKSSTGGSRQLIIAPDQLMDFRALPFGDESFSLVVFDPPHLVQNGKTGWLAKKYGKLGDDWRADIRAGFAECFRVLKPHGTLIFKWNEHEVKVSELLKLTPAKPLFGNRCGKNAKSHWIVFMRADGGEAVHAPADRDRSRDDQKSPSTPTTKDGESA